jgi:cell division protein FtsI/penicillin-binding protein 2
VPRGPIGGGGFSRPSSGSRHRRHGARGVRLSGKQRLAAVLVVAAAVLSWGFADGFGTGSSPEGTVQAFLLDWQQGDFMAAAHLTTGAGSYREVAAELASVNSDLDASAGFMSLAPITQHGDTATAEFTATFDLAEGSHQWTYTGRFGLVFTHGKWYIPWSPSVINPSLGPGDRLAVVTAYPPRAQVEDSAGQPLQQPSVGYQVGVVPGRLKAAPSTVAAFSSVAGLDAQQVLGQVRAAPPDGFLPLLTLPAAEFRSLWPRLSKVAGLTYRTRSERLFVTDAADVVGGVGAENAPMLRASGTAYEPGATAGESGLEQAYQASLAGTPTTSVVVVNAAGKAIDTLWTARGHAGVPVRTTINGSYQAAAARALAAQQGSGEIVAVNARTGGISAIATRQASGGIPLPAGGPLEARIAPGMAFSIVSAAALLADGVQPDAQVTCYPSQEVGGQTFTYNGQQSSDAGAQGTFASDFADGCQTALAGISTRLTPAELAAAEKSFGIGADWDLPLPAFSGSASPATTGAGLAAQAIGSSGVRMSPLALAMVAAEVDSGTGHDPMLVAAGQTAQWQAPLSGTSLDSLRALMREAVTTGTAQAANLGGTPVYGQAGAVQTAKNAWLSWFVGYRGSTAVAVLETGTTRSQAASALAASFLSAIG